MNLFVRELTAHRKSLVIWSIVMAAFMYLSMAKYATLSADAQASQKLMEAFPSTMQAAFGMTGLDLTTTTGYYGICFIFIAVMLAIHAGTLGAEIIAKEEVNKTAEFLYVRPIGRAKALALKLLAGIVLLAVLFGITWGISYHSIALVNGGLVPAKELWDFSLALGVMQLLFFALGVLAATALPTPKRAGAIISAVVYGAYVAYVMHGLSPDYSALKAVSPFAMYSAKDILNNQTIDPAYTFICLAVAVITLACSYFVFKRRDFRV